MTLVKKHLDLILDMVVLLLIYCFFLQYFPLEYMLMDTVVTGGDTGSHFKSAEYLKETLLPQGRVIGWYPGNYGGYPLFIMYFPLLYVGSVWMSAFFPLTVVFKFATVIGPILLPACTYIMLRLCRFRFPGPNFGAAASLLFLLDTSNSMWGGNLYSTLAGEFSYAFSFSLLFVLLGMVYRLMEQVKGDQERLDPKLILAAIGVLFLMGLSHGFTLFVSSLAILYFLFSPKFILKKSAVLLVVFGVGGLLFAGWFMQLLLNAPYTTGFNLVWTFASINEVLPPILIPTLILYLVFSVYALIPGNTRWQILKWNERDFLFFSWYFAGFSGVCFYSAEVLGLPDIRFIPFIHFLATVLGATVLGTVLGILCRNALVRSVLPLIGFCICILWGLNFPTDAKHWANWNFKGYEHAPGWPAYNAINQVLKGEYSQPRVAYEHSAKTNKLGTVRAFESLPYFAGRTTVEGLYFQSSLLSPFVFYAQSLYA
jgi:hypothetical protein